MSFRPSNAAEITQLQVNLQLRIRENQELHHYVLTSYGLVQRNFNRPFCWLIAARGGDS